MFPILYDHSVHNWMQLQFLYKVFDLRRITSYMYIWSNSDEKNYWNMSRMILNWGHLSKEEELSGTSFVSSWKPLYEKGKFKDPFLLKKKFLMLERNLLFSFSKTYWKSSMEMGFYIVIANRTSKLTHLSWKIDFWRKEFMKIMFSIRANESPLFFEYTSKISHKQNHFTRFRKFVLSI